MNAENLPEEFRQRIRKQLARESESFFQSYENETVHSLRVNPLKLDPAQLSGLAGFTLTPVPWEPLGFYYDRDDVPGKHPLHAAGAYYIQEASAQIPARLLSPGREDLVLDLCAAPGGKTTQMAALMENEGLLIANEIHPSRAKILSENVERCGIRNCIVTNEAPEKLAGRFAGFFTKILVDAPCSGEGMFRKNPDAISEWTAGSNAFCAARQKEILSQAAEMLRPGGLLCYSTCTFAEEENEAVIRDFLKIHPDFEPEKEVRLWPHRDPGEGHYAALLRKSGSLPTAIKPKDTDRKVFSPLEGILKDPMLPETRVVFFGDTANLLPENAPSLPGLKVLRAGLCLGTKKKERFLPSHSLALALSPDEAARSRDLSVDQARQYLSGLTFSCDAPSGWTLVTVCGISLGWGKAAGSILKNHYPKGLRSSS